MKILVLSCVAACLALCCWGGYQAIVSTESPRFGLFLEEADRDLGECPTGPSEVRLSCKNRSGQPHEILSVGVGCWPNACLRVKDSQPVTIPAGGTIEINCLVIIREPGPFEINSVVFADDGGLRMIEFSLRGVGVVPK